MSTLLDLVQKHPGVYNATTAAAALGLSLDEVRTLLISEPAISRRSSNSRLYPIASRARRDDADERLLALVEADPGRYRVGEAAEACDIPTSQVFEALRGALRTRIARRSDDRLYLRDPGRAPQGEGRIGALTRLAEKLERENAELRKRLGEGK